MDKINKMRYMSYWINFRNREWIKQFCYCTCLKKGGDKERGKNEYKMLLHVRHPNEKWNKKSDKSACSNFKLDEEIKYLLNLTLNSVSDLYIVIGHNNRKMKINCTDLRSDIKLH